jgi:hypothetical protein
LGAATFEVRRIFTPAFETLRRSSDGAKPADLPVEQPTKFETPKALDIMFPAKLRALADELIE